MDIYFFVLFEKRNGYLYRRSNFDRDGLLANRTGEGYQDAYVIYTIMKPELLKRKLDWIDKEEVLTDTKDEHEEMVSAPYYKADGSLIRKDFISSLGIHVNQWIDVLCVVIDVAFSVSFNEDLQLEKQQRGIR